MANLCSVSLTIFRDEPFTTEETADLLKALDETVVYDGPVSPHYQDESLIEIDITTRWSVPTDELKVIAEKYKANIRAVGREDAVGFVQVVCFNSKGVLVQDEEIGYRL